MYLICENAVTEVANLLSFTITISASELNEAAKFCG